MTMMMKNIKTKQIQTQSNIKRKAGSSIGWDTEVDGLGGTVDEEIQ